MLKIRLKRVGRRNDPSYRLVVVDSHQGPKSNNFVEQVGFYNPKTKERTVDGDRIKHWLSVGAQASDTVFNMLVSEKVIDGKKRNALPKRTPIVKVSDEADTPAEAVESTSDGEASASESAPQSGGSENAPEEEKASEETVVEEKPKAEAPQEPEDEATQGPQETDSEEKPKEEEVNPEA